MTSLLEVPDDGLKNIASFLPPPDLLQFLCVHPRLHNLSGNESFWRILMTTTSCTTVINSSINTSTDNAAVATTTTATSIAATTDNPNDTAVDEESVSVNNENLAKQNYLLRAYMNAPAYDKPSIVQWKPCQSSRLSPTSREGHLACTMGRKVVLTGGFTDDEFVYVLDTSVDYQYSPSSSFSSLSSGQQHHHDPQSQQPQTQSLSVDWQKVMPTNVAPWIHAKYQPPQRRHRQQGIFGGVGNDDVNDMNNHRGIHRRHVRNTTTTTNNNNENVRLSPSRVYGASLTALDEWRAIRFGGFRGGGYTGECNELALLIIQEDKDGEDFNNNNNNNNASTRRRRFKATWQVVRTNGNPMPRAYHTATLIKNRWLLIIGGMTTDGCILDESILDTQTWTWLEDVPITHETRFPKPTSRHGHSVVFDEKRNRMVLFGGGSGSDLLRSGRDNAEVWELSMDPKWKTATTAKEFQDTLPWEWGLIMLNDDSDSDDESWLDEDYRHHRNMVENIDDIDGDESDSNDSMPPLERRSDNGDPDDNNISVNDSSASIVIEDAIVAANREGGRTDDEANNEEDGNDDNSSYSSNRVVPPLERREVSNNSGPPDGDASYENASSNGRLPRLIPRHSRRRREHARLRRLNQLSDAEKLCLGRCHLGFRIGADTVMFAFGSGRPSTNRVLGFNLATNIFFRPKLAGGEHPLLPPPRFTAAGTLFGDHNSFLLVHGGYQSQESVAIENISVLDLAPALDRTLRSLPENPDFEPYPPVTQEDVHRHTLFGHHFGPHGGIGGMEDLLHNLFVEIAAGAGRTGPRVAGPGNRAGGLEAMLRNIGRAGIARDMAREGQGEGNGDDAQDDDSDEDGDFGVELGGAELMMMQMFGPPGMHQGGFHGNFDDDDDDSEIEEVN